jgi:hypothetical protein
VSNLHVLTELGWDGKVGCSSSGSGSSGGLSSSVVCHGLNATELRVDVLRPQRATANKLLKISADPMPAQFTGVLGAKKYGAAFAGDWNAPVRAYVVP